MDRRMARIMLPIIVRQALFIIPGNRITSRSNPVDTPIVRLTARTMVTWVAPPA